MTLQASGEISYYDIDFEIAYTVSQAGPSDMSGMTAEADDDTTITNTPDNISDWYSYNFTPAAPTGQSATYFLRGSNITIDWTDASNNEDEFEIEAYRNPTEGYVNIQTTAANAVQYVWTGYSTGETYTFRIRSGRDAANGGQKHSAWVYTNDVTT